MSAQKLPLLSEMERIEQSLISEKLDEIFERIDQEDIGFVITEEGQDKYVLCPYRWYENHFPDEVGCVVNSAVRQELAAESEDADAVRQFVRNHFAGFDERTLDTAVRDIERHLSSPLYKADRIEEWRSLQALLQGELEKRRPL